MTIVTPRVERFLIIALLLLVLTSVEGAATIPAVLGMIITLIALASIARNYLTQVEATEAHR